MKKTFIIGTVFAAFVAALAYLAFALRRLDAFLRLVVPDDEEHEHEVKNTEGGIFPHITQRPQADQ